MNFPTACDLQWRVRPYALATAPEEEAVFFRDILGFWFGGDSLPSLDSLTAGLSNVYGRDSNDYAVVAVSCGFDLLKLPPPLSLTSLSGTPPSPAAGLTGKARYS